MNSKAIFASFIVVLAAVAPARAQTYDQLGKWCYSEATYEQTVQGCTAVLKGGREAQPSAALYNRALAYHGARQYDRALQDYNEAIGLEPGYVDALNSRCYLRAIVGQFEAALADCNESLRLKPENAFTFDSRGFTYLKLGMFDAAIADFNAALRVDPGHTYSMFGRGVARVKKGDPGGKADMAGAKAKIPGIAEEFAKYGIRGI